MIHPSAMVAAGAEISADVNIGPFSIIGPDVKIGAGTKVGSHTTITGRTRIGSNNRIFSYVSLGEEPQDKKYAGEDTQLWIGDGNTIREFCTFNRGTVQDGGVTRIGNDNWIMAYVHIAHDCQIGNHTIFANNATLGGHVHIHDHVILGGFTGVHQFVHIGTHCFTGIASVITQDVPPYVMVAGNPTKPYGINSEGLRRRGFDAPTIAQIKAAYKTLYRSKLSMQEATDELVRQSQSCVPLQILVDFLRGSTRGIMR